MVTGGQNMEGRKEFEKVKGCIHYVGGELGSITPDGELFSINMQL